MSGKTAECKIQFQLEIFFAQNTLEKKEYYKPTLKIISNDSHKYS